MGQPLVLVLGVPMGWPMLVVALGLEVVELAALEVAAVLAAELGPPVVVANPVALVAGQAVANLAAVLVLALAEVAAMLAAVGHFVVNHLGYTGHLEALAVVGLELGNHLELERLASYPH